MHKGDKVLIVATHASTIVLKLALHYPNPKWLHKAEVTRVVSTASTSKHLTGIWTMPGICCFAPCSCYQILL
jgi:hypothetical protein